MTSCSPRKSRTDGRRAKEKILLAALGLFAEKGYAATSMREVAAAADVNLAAIGYHFGDKAGLYRAALYDVLNDALPDQAMRSHSFPELGLRDALRQYLRILLLPLEMGKAVQQSVQLRLRESVEPTGLLASPTAERDEVYTALLAMLTRHFGAATADDEIHALAFAIFALVSQLISAHDHLASLQPDLLAPPDAVAKWERRFTAYAMAIVDHESERRHALLRTAAAPAFSAAPLPSKACS